LIVRGKLVEAARRLEIRNPYTGQLVGSVSCDSAADTEEAVEAARGYDQSAPADERSRILRSAAQDLLESRDELSLLITSESGLCVKDSRREVERAYGNLIVASEEATRMTGEALPIQAGGQGKLAFTLREPIGVVAAITPFNRPLNQVAVKVAPAIAANNAVVVKPSEKTPLSALRFAEILLRNGLPERMIAVVTGDPSEVGEALISSPLVDMVTFTGSVATGEAIARKVGMKKLTLELGGNDPLIVLRDADLALAARLAAAGAYGNSGQSCRGVKRILVVEEVADDFVALLLEETRRKRCGDPFDPETDVGTVISQAAAQQIEERCGLAVRDGARLRCGGTADGALFLPAVLDQVPPTTDLVRHETFGPVAPVIRVKDVEEAIDVANGTIYGLQAGVVTRDLELFLHIARRLRVGGVNLLEGPNFDSPSIPFGGVKKSGIGREGIRYAMAEMTTVKTVVTPW
jgi:putative phosphonoacetaldehyde dehydrogenase